MTNINSYWIFETSDTVALISVVILAIAFLVALVMQPNR